MKGLVIVAALLAAVLVFVNAAYAEWYVDRWMQAYCWSFDGAYFSPTTGTCEQTGL
jgi:hypothetical protein